VGIDPTPTPLFLVSSRGGDLRRGQSSRLPPPAESSVIHLSLSLEIIPFGRGLEGSSERKLGLSTIVFCSVSTALCPLLAVLRRYHGFQSVNRT